MDHLAFIDSLPPERRGALTELSDGPALRHLTGHAGLVALGAVWIGAGWPLWWAVLPLHGIVLVFLFTLSHECTHRTAFRTQWLNDAVGHAIAPLLLLPFLWFRYFHLAHHRHTGDPDRDPELAGGGHPKTWTAWLVHVSGWPYWRGNGSVLLSHAAGRVTAPYLPPRRHAALIREARIICGLYLLAGSSLFVSPLLFWIWLLPVLIGQPFLRLYLLAEHGRCPRVADMFANSRTTYTTRALRWLAWNMPYHAEHHGMPTVPFHRLPALHAAARAHLSTTAPGYGAFTRDYLRGLDG